MREVAVTERKTNTPQFCLSIIFFYVRREYLAPAGATAPPRTRDCCEIMPGRTSSPRPLERLLARAALLRGKLHAVRRQKLRSTQSAALNLEALPEDTPSTSAGLVGGRTCPHGFNKRWEAWSRQGMQAEGSG